MHNRMQEEMRQSSYTNTSENNQPGSSKNSSPKEQADDYIDFEEVK
jgi:hypothetical protein